MDELKRTVSYREEVLRYASGQYQTTPEYPWMDDPRAAVLRHGGSRKWYGLIMEVPRNRLGLSGDEPVDTVDILNVKCEPDMGVALRTRPGILPAYHMNKEHWISILLDGTVRKDTLLALLDQSFELTKSRR